MRQLEIEVEIHKKKPPERGTKNISLQFYKEKESHLLEEVSFIIIINTIHEVKGVQSKYLPKKTETMNLL